MRKRFSCQGGTSKASISMFSVDRGVKRIGPRRFEMIVCVALVSVHADALAFS